MATVTAVGSFAYISNQVAERILVLDALRFGIVSNGYTILSRSATQIQYLTPDGTTLTFLGSNFTTGATLTVPLMAYTLNGVTETAPGTVYSLTAFTLNSPTSITLSEILNGNDQLAGSTDNDSLFAGNGDDTLNGGAGSDIMEGGNGDDTYVVDNAADLVNEATGSGTDTVFSAVNLSLSGSSVFGIVENLTLTGGALTGTGNFANNVINGNAQNNVLVGLEGNDTLDGGAGGDTLRGGFGDDTYVIDVAGDTIVELPGEGFDTVRSAINFNVAGTNIENVTLTGSATNATGDGNNNTLIGNAAANVLDGGLGVDVMRGGLGNDTYIVDNLNDLVQETSAGGGVDLVLSSSDFNLSSTPSATFVENLTLTGTAFFATGNALNNILTGNGGNNVLDGVGGADAMFGGAGNDTYVVDQAGDVVGESLNAGLDTVFIGFFGTGTAYTLSVNVENLIANGMSFTGMTLTGNDLNNTIQGTFGDDILNGMAGGDLMFGGSGVNTYVVDNAGDVVTDDGVHGDGDTVQSSISFSLFDANGVDNLVLTGAAAINGNGNAVNNVLTGNSADNTLTGDFGNDTLDGGLGNDTLRGGVGNDTYVVNAAGDIVIELPFEGVDTVKSSITYSIQNNLNLEDVTLTGAGAINATGNSGFNVLTGNDGANVLDGRESNDQMSGGLGNDTYFVDNGMDSVSETTAGAAGGVDTVIVSTSFFQLGDNVENLATTYTDSFFGYGNALVNNLAGNIGDDLLNGQGGADVMAGLDGDDTYIVDNTGDSVIETAVNGFDSVLTSVTFTLPVGVEELLNNQGIGSFIFTGNALDNNIIVSHGNSNNDVLNGGAGADHMAGGYGDDVYMVDNAGDVVFDVAGIDRVESSVNYSLAGTGAEDLVLLGAAVEGRGTDANNRITGNALANFLSGGDGDDTLDGGAGADEMRGGTGNDSFVVDNAGDTVFEAPGEGFDTVASSVTVDLNVLSGAVEALTLTGALAINGTGNALTNVLTGNDAANVLDGGIGADVMQGGLGGDTYHVDDPGDLVHESVGGAPGGIDLVVSSVTFDLAGGGQQQQYLENLTLVAPQSGGLAQAIDGRGNELNNILIGNAAANLLDGRTGADSMTGGLGDDTYIVDQTGDAITEAAGAGTDTVESSVSFILPVNVEELFLLNAVTAFNATGNAGNNLLVGNNLDNVLDGLGGNDTMVGGYGNDTYRVDAGGDVVLEALNDGTDTVVSSVDIVLGANLENLTLIGGATTGYGNALDNTLTGNGSLNTLAGGYGNDTYNVDATGDIVNEVSSGGFDTVRSTATYTLLDINVENLVLIGSAPINGTGNGIVNQLTGNDAANVLDGGGGADIMQGGPGNDTFIVDNVADSVSENDLLAGGTDVVHAKVSYTVLDTDVENVLLLEGAISATGNASRNVLTGNGSNNILNGMGGADTMIGGAGNDTYSVDTGGDRIIELAGGGTDTVNATANYTLPAQVENLTLSGTAITGRGNALDNFIVGNALDNILNGEAGADTMDGGIAGGNDTYFVDNAGDVVVEFENEGASDTIISTVDVELAGSQVQGGNVEHVILRGTAVTALGNGLHNTLTGNGLANTLNGGAGNDTLDGGRGADTMAGGLGNDNYTVDNSLDVVIEVNELGSNDSISSTVSYTLPTDVENLFLQENRNLDGTGNGAINVITGNSGSNRLNGLLGADQIFGNDGDDVIVWDAADTQRSGGVGHDTLAIAAEGADSTGQILTPVPGLGFLGFERVDLTGFTGNPMLGSNTLVIDPQDVIDMSDDDQVFVNGDGNDVVDLTGAWILSPVQVSLDGTIYNRYTANLAGPDPFIYIQQGVAVV